MEVVIGGATIAVVNAIKQIQEKRDYWPLVWTVAAGIVGAIGAYAYTLQSTESLMVGFLTGMGASGGYTLVKTAVE